MVRLEIKVLFSVSINKEFIRIFMAAAVSSFFNGASYWLGMQTVQNAQPGKISTKNKIKKWIPEGPSIIVELNYLRVLPIGTKLHFEKYDIQPDIPGRGFIPQSVSRLNNGDKRSELDKLVPAVMIALQLHPPIPKEEEIKEVPASLFESNLKTQESSPVNLRRNSEPPPYTNTDLIQLEKKISNSASEMPKLDEEKSKNENPINSLYEGAIDGLKQLGKTYGYKIDEDLNEPEEKSLDDNFYDFRLHVEKDANNPDLIAAGSIRKSIKLIRLALKNGIKTNTELPPLALKVRENWEYNDFLSCNHLMNKAIVKQLKVDPKNVVCMDYIHALQAIIKIKIDEFSTFRHEVSSQQVPAIDKTDK